MVEFILDENLNTEYHFLADTMYESILDNMISGYRDIDLSGTIPTILVPDNREFTTLKVLSDNVEIPVYGTYSRIVNISSSINKEATDKLHIALELR